MMLVFLVLMLHYLCFFLLPFFKSSNWTLFTARIFGRCISKGKVSLVCMCVVVMTDSVIVMAYILLSLL